MKNIFDQCRHILNSILLISLLLLCVHPAIAENVSFITNEGLQKYGATTAEPRVNITQLRKAAEDNSSFGLALYQRLGPVQRNLFFSPYSISTAFAMTYAGARGNTQKEIAKVLHFSLPQPTLHQAFSEIQTRMSEIQKSGYVQLGIANSLWIQNGYSLLDKFLDLNKQYYNSEPHFVDFATNVDASRTAINAWVEKETDNKIRELIKSGSLQPSTSLILCNAIYFKGSWQRPFKRWQTKDGDFIVTPNQTVRVPMMNQVDRYKMATFDNFSAIELPYKGNDLSMVILLPKTVDGLKQIENKLTEDNVSKWLDVLTKTHSVGVALRLPRFKTVSSFELAKDLAAMGMPTAFNGADLSGISNGRNLSINNVIHEAFISVNEEGTEAAAAAAIAIMKGGFKQVAEFYVDHPFVFLIRETNTGSILFLGRVINPTI